MVLDAGKTKCKFAAQLRFWFGLFPGLQTVALPLCLQMVFPWCTVHEKEEIHCALSFYKATDLTRLEPGPHAYNFFKHYIFFFPKGPGHFSLQYWNFKDMLFFQPVAAAA